MVSPHRINGNPDPLTRRCQGRLFLAFAFFSFFCDSDDQLAFIEAAAGAHTVRNVKRSTLSAFG